MNDKKLKKLDLSKPYFEANGKKYLIETNLSIARFCEFQILEQEVGYSLTFRKLFDNLKELWELMNASKFVESSIKLDNLMRGIAKMEEKEPAVLKLCSLFINTENENRSEWNDDLATQKIEDWKAEGYEVDGFFQLALNFIDGFLPTYHKVTQSISEETESLAQRNRQ